PDFGYMPQSGLPECLARCLWRSWCDSVAPTALGFKTVYNTVVLGGVHAAVVVSPDYLWLLWKRLSCSGSRHECVSCHNRAVCNSGAKARHDTCSGPGCVTANR